MNYRILACMLVILFAFPVPAFPEDGSGGRGDGGRGLWNVDFSGRAQGLALGEADVEDDKGSVSVAEAEVELATGLFDIGYTATRFSWTDMDKLPFGNGNDDPWKTLHALSVGVNRSGSISRDWRWFGGVSLSSAFEQELGGSFGAGARAGATWLAGERLSVSLGVAAGVDALDVSALPLLMVRWDDRDESGQGWFVEGGFPRLEAGYDVSHAFGLSASLGGVGNTWRLADDSAVSEEGYVKMNGLRAAASFTWRPVEGFELSVGPVYSFGRSLKTYDEDGDEMETYDLDNSWGGFLSLSVEF